MGLGIYWELLAPNGTDAAAAVQVVRRLRESALSAGFGEVSDVVEAVACRPAGEAGAPEDETAQADRAWALAQGMVSVAAPTDDDPARVVRVVPEHVVAFRAYSAGADDAVFGLACYGSPGVVEGEAGYRWSGGGVTQGAAQRNGLPGFLRAHRAIVVVLDRARSAGLSVSVRDDGGFWESRDPKVLFDRLGDWQDLVAAIARKRMSGKAVPLASEMRHQIEARRRERPRLDREPAEELEG